MESRPMTRLDRFCIMLVGVGVFLSIALLVAIVFALAIMVGGTAPR